MERGCSYDVKQGDCCPRWVVLSALVSFDADSARAGTELGGYQTNTHYFNAEIARSERPNILWKDGKTEKRNIFSLPVTMKIRPQADF